MKDRIERRVKENTEIFLQGDVTVRGLAEITGMSKSTVHKDLTERLRIISYGNYIKVQQILETNKAERHIRGGEATRRKYEELRIPY